MKPITPDFDAVAAITPVRYEPCSAAKINDPTFGDSTTESTIAKVVSGNFGATAASAALYANPTAMTGLYPPSARRVSSSSRVASVALDPELTSLISTPRSV